MKNKNKITLFIAIILVCIFTAYGIYGMNKAYALSEDDFVVGTSNLNGTQENSAKVGDVLKLPEKGWKRYDDTNKNIYYQNFNLAVNQDEYYCESFHQAFSFQDIDNRITFKFYGTKLRLMGLTFAQYSNKVQVTIDGDIVEYFSPANRLTVVQAVLYEKKDLDLKEHTVTLKTIEPALLGYVIDSIDIDENGQLLGKDETVKPQSITLDKTAIDLLKGNKDKITATVLPEDASNKKVVWSSSDETIATVDQEGNVTALKSGQVDITAKVDGTDLSASCKVIVTEKEAEPQPTPGKAILSISLVDGKTKDYDLSMEEVNKFINWYETKGSSTYKFDKNISPYKSVKEYIVHDKITSFEVREYE